MSTQPPSLPLHPFETKQPLNHVTAPMQNVRPGTIAYTAVPKPGGGYLYSPVIAEETVMHTANGLRRAVQYVPYDPSKAQQARAPASVVIPPTQPTERPRASAQPHPTTAYPPTAGLGYGNGVQPVYAQPPSQGISQPADIMGRIPEVAYDRSRYGDAFGEPMTKQQAKEAKRLAKEREREEKRMRKKAAKKQEEWAKGSKRRMRAEDEELRRARARDRQYGDESGSESDEDVYAPRQPHSTMPTYGGVPPTSEAERQMYQRMEAMRLGSGAGGDPRMAHSSDPRLAYAMDPRMAPAGDPRMAMSTDPRMEYSNDPRVGQHSRQASRHTSAAEISYNGIPNSASHAPFPYGGSDGPPPIVPIGLDNDPEPMHMPRPSSSPIPPSRKPSPMMRPRSVYLGGPPGTPYPFAGSGLASGAPPTPAANGFMISSLDARESFDRPLGHAAFTPFQPLTIIKNVIKNLPRIAMKGQLAPGLPAPVLACDMQHEDWARFMQDMVNAWSATRELSQRDYIHALRTKIEEWNALFMTPRLMQAALFDPDDPDTDDSDSSFDSEDDYDDDSDDDSDDFDSEDDMHGDRRRRSRMRSRSRKGGRRHRRPKKRYMLVIRFDEGRRSGVRSRRASEARPSASMNIGGQPQPYPQGAYPASAVPGAPTATAMPSASNGVPGQPQPYPPGAYPNYPGYGYPSYPGYSGYPNYPTYGGNPMQPQVQPQSTGGVPGMPQPRVPTYGDGLRAPTSLEDAMRPTMAPGGIVRPASTYPGAVYP